MKSKIIISTCALLLIFSVVSRAQAHKPEIVSQNQENIIIQNPEISYAFYDELNGAPRTYIINENTNFNLYVNLLVPESLNSSSRYSAEILKDGQLVGKLDGSLTNWEIYYEEFANDYYLKGLELRQEVSAGKYEIKVFGANNQNQGKYVLAVGEKESFGIGSLLKSFITIPKLKNNFFQVSILSFFEGIIGKIFLGIIAIVLIIVYIIYRKLRRT